MLQLIQTIAATEFRSRDVVALTLSGTKAADRKESALNQADAIGVIAISNMGGKVGKAAQAMKSEFEMKGVAASIAAGNFHAFAVTYAAATGQVVKFGLKDTEGKTVRKASDDFRKFGMVLDHAMTQLEDKGKVFNAKNGYTAAAGALMELISLHTMAVELMDVRDAMDAARRAEQQQTLELQSEKGAE